MAQHEIVESSPLLGGGGQLTQAGWGRNPLLDCNLEDASHICDFMSFPLVVVTQCLDFETHQILRLNDRKNKFI